MEPVGIGILGTGFVAEIHAASCAALPEANLVAVASRTPGNAEQFAEEWGAERSYTDAEGVINDPEVDCVLIAVPNDLHCQMTVEIAQAGKDVICEKPLCRTLTEADRMIQVCRDNGVLLMYAEQLCFAPKYARAKQLVDEGALGKAFLVKQSEEHDGPHKPWFWDVDRSGGGVLLDMGCHSVEFARWIFGKPRALGVTAVLNTYVHREKTRGEDHSLCMVEYEGARLGHAENSWAKKSGGVDDKCEIYGSQGSTRADLLHGSSLLTYSEAGYGYAVEKSGATSGLTFTMFEENWNYGFPQEMRHFCRCVRGLEEPVETGEDGKAVLEILWAAYASAGRGERVELPFQPPEDAEKPIDLWR